MDVIKITSESYRLLIIDPEIVLDYIHRDKTDDLLDLILYPHSKDTSVCWKVEPFKTYRIIKIDD